MQAALSCRRLSRLRVRACAFLCFGTFRKLVYEVAELIAGFASELLLLQLSGEVLQFPGDLVESGCGLQRGLRVECRAGLLEGLRKILQSASRSFGGLQKFCRHVLEISWRQRIEALADSLHLVRGFVQSSPRHLLGSLLKGFGLSKNRGHLGEAVRQVFGVELAGFEFLIDLFELPDGFLRSDVALLEILNHFLDLLSEQGILSRFRLCEQLQRVFKTGSRSVRQPEGWRCLKL